MNPKHNNPDTDQVPIKATSDLFIATLFSAPKNERILRGVINAVLTNSGHVAIKEATVLNPFSVREFAVNKQIVLDVRVRDELSRLFNIEIQTTPHVAFAERMVFGWADTYSGQLQVGGKYHSLHPVFSIVITEFKMFPGGLVHLVFELRERYHPEIILSNHVQMHFLCIHEVIHGHLHVLDSVSPDLRHWLTFMAFGGLKEEKEMSLLVDHDPLIMEADSELRLFSADPQMRDMERRHKLWLLDYYAGLEAVEAARQEGEVRGEVRGKVEERADKVLRALDRRMGAVPESLAKQVRQITDTEKLNELFDLALDCKSIDEFAKRI